jgi:carboxyl-terminal processing protease
MILLFTTLPQNIQASRKYLIMSILLFYFNANFVSIAQNPGQDLPKIKDLIEKNHVKPRAIDDQYSKAVFKLLLDQIDPENNLFTQTEIRQLMAYETKLDDELNGQATDFLPVLTSLFKNQIQKSKAIIQKVAEKAFNFEQKQTLTKYALDTLIFPKDEAEATLRWEKKLKYRVLSLLYNKLKNSPKISQTDLMGYEPTFRKKVKDLEMRKLERLLNHALGLDKWIISKYYLALTMAFDPHTNYFSFAEVQNFESSMATEGLSFGFDLEETETGEIKIGRLVPGGSAWRSNELHKGDVLIKAKWPNKDEIDLVGLDIEELGEVLDQSNTEKLALTVRKTDGSFKTIELMKTKIREDENIVKSFIINGLKKIGYISLPGFYAESEEENNLGCANDVAREVIKMKKEGIEGIILDLRYNGGGSLIEGLNLAGIFIDEGPLTVSLKKDGKPTVLKDANRGTVFDGPLVVLINGQSASASEVLAAALQDYNRALIVGSNTYGKATGQRIMIMADDLRNMDEKKLKESGFAKVTTLKLYRVTGKTAQLNGVKPDIDLPDIFEALEIKEANQPNVLRADTINKKVYYTPLSPLPVAELKQKSTTRRKLNQHFVPIEKIRDELKANTQSKSITLPLDWQGFLAWQNKFGSSFEEISQNKAAQLTLNVDNLAADKTLLQMDAYGREINQQTLKNIQTDIYIAEAMAIIQDWLALKK